MPLSQAPVAPGIVPWIRLTKAVLCLPIALSAGFGYVLYAKEWTTELVLVVTSVLFLAGGAATLNSLQERSVDALFERTKTRPLVTGTIPPHYAGMAAGLLLVVSLLILFFTVPVATPLFLALLGPLVYNGIYTPLKHKTGFALLVGGIAGALPPLIGWSSAGGSIMDTRAVSVALLFFLWQIPHFFMVLLAHKNDYKRSKIYNLASSFTEDALRRIALIWTIALTITAISLSTIPFFLTTTSRVINLIAGLAILLIFSYNLLLKEKAAYRFLFHTLNTIFFADMVLISLAEIFFKL